MYARLNILTVVFLVSKVNFGNGENLPSCVYDACDRITDPEYLTTSCCPEMDNYVNIIKECRGNSPTITSCKQATCVSERYGILTDGEIDLKKAELVLEEVAARNPSNRPLVDLVKKYCIRGNYTCFPSEDPYCDDWKLLNCSFFANRIACPITYSDGLCDDIADDVKTCRPYQRKFVRELNKGCSNRCLAP